MKPTLVLYSFLYKWQERFMQVTFSKLSNAHTPYKCNEMSRVIKCVSHVRTDEATFKYLLNADGTVKMSLTLSTP